MHSIVYLVALCLFAGVQAGTWREVQKDFAAVGLSVSFQSNLTGWVAGGSSDGEPLLLFTDDGGKTLTNDPAADTVRGELLSIDLYDANNGLAGALGFAGLPCGVYTTDGKKWLKIQDGVDILCAVQDVKAPAPGVFVMVGEFSHPLHLGADGIQISVDSGKNWRLHNWNQNISARYGWFASQKVGFLTGGQWPNTTNNGFTFPRQLSQHITHNGKHRFVDIKTGGPATGYWGVIAGTSDGGETWKTLVNLKDQGIYFNEISCSDVLHCWVVAEGVNQTTGVTAAYIYGTSDGFGTVQQQYYFEHGSLVAVNMLNSTYGWAAGADTRRSGLNSFLGTFFLTTDGKTWTQSNQLGNFYAYDLSTVNADYAYASGLDELALAELAQFSP